MSRRDFCKSLDELHPTCLFFDTAARSFIADYWLGSRPQSALICRGTRNAVKNLWSLSLGNLPSHNVRDPSKLTTELFSLLRESEEGQSILRPSQYWSQIPSIYFYLRPHCYSHYLKWRENISMVLKNWDHKWVLRTALLKNLFPMEPRDIIISSPPCWSSLQCTVIILKLSFPSSSSYWMDVLLKGIAASQDWDHLCLNSEWFINISQDPAFTRLEWFQNQKHDIQREI